MTLKKYKSQGKAVKVAVNSKEENSEDFRLHFAQEFGLSTPCFGTFRTFEWPSSP